MTKPWDYLLEYIDSQIRNELFDYWDSKDEFIEDMIGMLRIADNDDHLLEQSMYYRHKDFDRYTKQKKFRKLADAQCWVFTHKLTQEPHHYILYKWNADYEEYEETTF